jgi:hypothetical protein
MLVHRWHCTAGKVGIMTIIPRNLTTAQAEAHGFVKQSDGTYRHPQTRSRRVACRKCGKWVTYTSRQLRDVPSGYCRACQRECRRAEAPVAAA